MKKVILFAIALVATFSASAQIKIGETIPDIKFDIILNTKEHPAGLQSLKGKVIWLEFWATWCGPCVEALPHLQQLQKQFAGQLQVITISTEREKRIKQFIINKPSNLWFALDTADKFQAYFPYRTIPHAVLIDKNGKVVAITLPREIDDKTITNVIAGRPINLSVKTDNLTNDPIKTYFSADANVKSRFLVQPEISGLSGRSKTYPADSAFKNRRISIINLPLETIYRIAYGNMPYGRTIDLTPKEDIKQNKTNYCIDLIVPKGHENELMPTLRKELASRFDLKAGIEQREKEVYILKIADESKINRLKRSTDNEESFGASHGAFSGQGIRLSKIADYLESFGLVKMPVVDETGIAFKYDISFDYQPEKDGSLMEAINQMGLKLEKGQRKIDMLVFR